MYTNALGALMLAAATTTPVVTNLPPSVATNAPITQPVLATRAAAATLTNGLNTVDAMVGTAPVAGTPVAESVGSTLRADRAPAATPAGADRDPAATPAGAWNAAAPAPAAAPNSPIAKMGETDEIKVAGLGNVEMVTDDAHTPTSVRLADPNAIILDENTRVDITCEDATVADILRQFRKTVGANIISVESTNLQRRVSVRLNNAPWLPSLESILSTRGFRLEPRDGAYFVAENKEVAVPLFTRTYKLRHAAAEELAKLFNQSYGTVGPDGKVKKSVAMAYPSANVVIVTGEQKVLSDCEAIIAAVDEAVSQIYIEARFIELSTEALHKLGVQWNQLESWGASASSLKAGIERNDGRLARYYQDKTQTRYTPTVKDANGNEVASDRTAVDYVTRNYATGSISDALGAGRTSDSMNWFNARGFSGQLSADDFRIAMSAFEQMNDVKVFSNPKVVVSNGKEAVVDMTTKFPNVRVQATRNTANGSDSFDISTQLEVIPGEDKLMFAKEAFYSWGITLSVKPRVAPDGIINVEIIPTISQLDNTSVTEYTGFYKVSGGDSSAYSSYPVIDVKRITTDFTMKDGSTAVIGGLSKTTEEEVDSGIPYLRKLPWIGQKLFGWKSRQKMQKEIVVFVTLGIANPEEMKTDVGLPKNAVLGRQYVDGTQLEPGDREGGAAGVMKLDTSDMATRNREKPAAKPADDTEVKPVAQPESTPRAAAPAAEPVGSTLRADRAPAATPAAAESVPQPDAKQSFKVEPVATKPLERVAPKTAPVTSSVPMMLPKKDGIPEKTTAPAVQPAVKAEPVATKPAVKAEPVATKPAVKAEPVAQPVATKPAVKAEPAPAVKTEPVGSALRADRAPAAKPTVKAEPAPAVKAAPAAQPAVKAEPVTTKPAVKSEPVGSTLRADRAPAATPAATPAAAPAKKTPVMKPLLSAPEPEPVKKAPVMKPLLPAPASEAAPAPVPEKKVTVMKPLLSAPQDALPPMGPVAEKKVGPVVPQQPSLTDLLLTI